jgi:predicted transcriptional regulator
LCRESIGALQAYSSETALAYGAREQEGSGVGRVDGNSDGDSESKRAQILAFIAEHPGAHLRKIKRELNLAMGVIQYHIYRLEKAGKIVSHRRGLYKRFYPILMFGDGQQEMLDVLFQETERDILLFLIQNPNATQKELSEYVKIAPSSINWHMRRLSKIIQSKREGVNVRYHVKVNPSEMLALLKSYQPAVWERWADRLANMLSE